MTTPTTTEYVKRDGFTNEQFNSFSPEMQAAIWDNTNNGGNNVGENGKLISGRIYDEKYKTQAPAVVTSQPVREKTQESLAGLQDVEKAITVVDQSKVTANDKNGDGIPDWLQPNEADDLYTKEFKRTALENETEYDSYRKKVDQIMNGSYPLTSTQQAMVQSIRDSIDRQKEEQRNLNQAQLGSLTMAGIRSGRQRYTTETNIDNLADEQAKGLQRIAKIENDGLALINQVKEAANEKAWKQLNDAYGAFQSNQKERSNALKELISINQKSEELLAQKVENARKAQIDYSKQISEQQTFNYEKGINQPFYVLGGSLFNALDGSLISSKEEAARLGVKDDLSNAQVIEATAAQKFAPGSIGEYQFFQSLSPEEQKAYTAYQNADANRKRTVTNVYTGGDYGSQEITAIKSLLSTRPGDGSKQAGINAINSKYGADASTRYSNLISQIYDLPEKARTYAASMPSSITLDQWLSARSLFIQENSYADPMDAGSTFDKLVPKPSGSSNDDLNF
jgi:hypothetical protein